jgi:chorismate dehydratase
MKKIRVAAVSYLNTKPLLYGIFNHPVYEFIDLELAVPSQCAVLLEEGKVDMALLPSGALAGHPEFGIVSDYCIGAENKVRTVCIYSAVPMSEITDIWLDGDSRTSVLLCRYLVDHFWKQNVRWHSGDPDPDQKITGTSAALLIGDKALDAEVNTPYIYDLAEAWRAMYDLPFAFAVWASGKPLDTDFLRMFNEAQHLGLQKIDELTMLLANTRRHFSVMSYYRDNISFVLDEAKRQSLNKYLSLVQTYL